MPGWELMGNEELESLNEIFTTSRGVLFAHGFDARRNGRFRVREFEKAFAQRMDSKYCQAVSSGTAAGTVALRALGIGSGDEVITQAFTFVATIESIMALGAVPVVVDVDQTLNMCPKALEAAITPRTKCILPVHMLGNPARMEEILAIGKKHGIPVVEDACEALGATYKGKCIGTLGEIGFFSLDFGKTITAGEGGCVLSQKLEHHQIMSAYHDHGHECNPKLPRGRDTAQIAGFNYRMTELQAAVVMAQLKKLDFILERNRKNKAYLKKALQQGFGSSVEFRVITDPQGELADTLMFFLPSETSAKRAVEKLASVGVGTKNVPDAMEWHFASYWGRIWEHHPIYRKNYREVWNTSKQLLDRCISLPILVNSQESELEQVAEKVIAAVNSQL